MMSPRRRGVPVDRYIVYVVLIWLGIDVRSAAGVPCPREEGDHNVLLDTHDICTPGDTCKTDCTPQDENFKCSVYDETGWRQYENRQQTGYFSLANENGPELEAISMHHKKYNATGRTYFRPALSITINISAEILATSATKPRIPEALLVRISGVNDSDSVRDDFYTDTPLYRLYSFRNYTPTSRDRAYPRQAILKCIDSLDACSVKVYRLEITAFVPSIDFKTRTVYTITAPNNRNQNLPPVIATALHPGGGNVTVVFETGGGTRVTNVSLVRVNQTQASYNQRVPPKTNRVRFQSVTVGMYTAMIEIAGNNYHSHPFCVRKSELDDDCLSTFPLTEDRSDPDSEPPNVILILTSFLFLLFLCTMVAVVLYWNKQRLTRLNKHNNQTPQVENVTRILLLNRDQDQQTAKLLMDHADTHFPGVKFVYIQEPEAETDIPNNKLIEKAVRSCDHIAVIWSPPEVEEKDIFEETITNESIITGNRNVDLSVIFSSDQVDNTSLPVEFNGARKFYLKTELQSFFHHCFSQSSELPDSLRYFHKSPSNQQINVSYTNIPCTKHEDECEPPLEKHSLCPVHGRNDIHDSNFNIIISEPETRQEDSQPDQLAYTSCPIHGTFAQPGIDIAFASETNSSLESKFLLLNASS